MQYVLRSLSSIDQSISGYMQNGTIHVRKLIYSTFQGYQTIGSETNVFIPHSGAKVARDRAGEGEEQGARRGGGESGIKEDHTLRSIN